MDYVEYAHRKGHSATVLIQNARVGFIPQTGEKYMIEPRVVADFVSGRYRVSTDDPNFDLITKRLDDSAFVVRVGEKPKKNPPGFQLKRSKAQTDAGAAPGFAAQGPPLVETFDAKSLLDPEG